jgi:hypothetical protein
MSRFGNTGVVNEFLSVAAPASNQLQVRHWGRIFGIRLLRGDARFSSRLISNLLQVTSSVVALCDSWRSSHSFHDGFFCSWTECFAAKRSRSGLLSISKAVFVSITDTLPTRKLSSGCSKFYLITTMTSDEPLSSSQLVQLVCQSEVSTHAWILFRSYCNCFSAGTKRQGKFALFQPHK